MKIYDIKDLASFKVFQEKTKDEYSKHLSWLNSLKPKYDTGFSIKGFSYTAGTEVDFISDFSYSGGFPDVNWRERVVCPITGLNNRMRAAIQIFDILSNAYYTDNIYIMEQLTQLYTFLKYKYQNLIGSEYLGESIPFGATDSRGIRNENATALSFSDNTFSCILSFDVFEHIYDYVKSFQECYRVLSPGGCLIFTVPFDVSSSKNSERAIVLQNGKIKHLLPPEYHGDPLSSEGILCFRHYGWDMLDDLRRCGFIEASAKVFYSESFGYLTNQIIFYCKKPN